MERILKLVLFLGVLFSGTVLGQDGANAITPLKFETVAQQERYRHFSKVLRCPLCQNQNLNGSNSGVAGDLRRELHRLISENKTDDEVIEFMRSRYGDFILYDPPLNASTSALWFGPLVFLLIGLLTIVFMVRRQRTAAAVAILSEADKSSLQSELSLQKVDGKE